MIYRIINTHGTLKTTVVLSSLCIIASMAISTVFLYFVGIPTPGSVLFLAFLCPAIIAPIVIISFCRLAENLQKSQERYLSLFENASDVIQVLKPNGQILYVNPAWYNVIGYNKDEALNLNFFDIIHPDYKERCLSHFEKTLKKGTSGTIEAIFLSKDGKRIVLNGSANTKYDREGNPSLINCIFQNITEKRFLEDELIKMQKLESVGVLAGGIAHDFNNLLTSILGNLSLAKILSDKPESNSYQKIEEAEKATLRAKDLTQQLLTFSKGGDPVKEIISINELIQDNCQFVLRGSNVKCKLDLPESLYLVEADKGQISQVIHNLVINADHAMPDGGEINIHASNVQISSEDGLPLDEGNYVLITVADQGTGISEKHISKIFDPYFSTKHEGHGLGLATSYSIIKKHSGLLSVDSKLGKGSIFKFYLPASTETLLSKKSSKENIFYGKGSILLMDDEKYVREVGKELLNHLGYEVTAAADGKQAIDVYRKAYEENMSFDAVVLDLTVPGGMGGKETLKQLISIDPSVKAIITSGYANDPTMGNYKQHGFAGVVSKPYKIESLGKVLHDVLSSKQEGTKTAVAV